MLEVVQIQTVAIILILSYFIGNFQSAVLFSKRFLHDDVRQHGSGNPGATNMTRVFGTKWGVITFLGDAFKCFLGVALGAYLGRWWGVAVQDSALDWALGAYVGGLGVVLGHCWRGLLLRLHVLHLPPGRGDHLRLCPGRLLPVPQDIPGVHDQLAPVHHPLPREPRPAALALALRPALHRDHHHPPSGEHQAIDRRHRGHHQLLIVRHQT